MAFSLATFNVKDLFEAGISPGGSAPTRDELDAKLDCLSKVVARVDADVLALQEVGSAAVLGELRDRLERRGGYGEPIVGTADARGIRNAVLTRFPVARLQVHAPTRLDFPVFRAGDPPPFGDRIPMRRGVVQATVDAGAAGQVDVLVTHFKSNRPLFERNTDGTLASPGADIPSGRTFAEAELRSLVWRASEALFVRGLVDDLVRQSSDAQVAVMGDLNDRPGSLALRMLAGVGRGRLHSCADLVEEARRFSILHKGRGDVFDYVLVTESLRARAASAHFYNESLRDHGALPEPVSSTPDSDHAAFAVRFS